ncbi:hypothetical protein B9Z55_008088 [Caenorhabditis nigoni]|nr:hypothetical protein B9Z55_008088 [Caenorhabditis nigoni]
MKFLPIIFLFLLFSSQSQALYKLVTVFGSPEFDDCWPWKVITGRSWEYCLDYCLSSSESIYCHMVYSDSDACLFFMVGDYVRVRNYGASSYTDERVAFKVDLPNDECLESASSTLTSHTGSYESSDSLGVDSTSFEISVTPKSFEVSYNYDNECSRPWRAEIPCETCSYRMYSFRGSLTMDNGESQGIKTWTQCLNLCLKMEKCIFAAATSYMPCYTFGIEKFTDFTLNTLVRMTPYSASFLAIKLTNTTPSKCTSDRTVLFNSTMDVTSFLEPGSGHINYAMQMNITGNTVNVEWYEPDLL